jgi:tRNA A-37 threonylcarbamoyl transferase component Bud32
MLFHVVSPVMTERLTFDVDQGRPVVRKAALDRPHALAREADALGEAAGPGVVQVLRIEGPPGAPEALVLEAISCPDLADADMSVAHVAGVVASVAATIGRLHHAGVAHGGIAPEHVLAADGGPVLCGFGAAATRAGLDDIDGAWAAATAADVADLGRMIDTLTSEAKGDDALLRHALRRISERATRPEPADRPPAEVLAASLRDLVCADGAMSLPRSAIHECLARLRPSADTQSERPRRPVRRRALVVAGTGAAALAATLVGVPVLTRDAPAATAPVAGPPTTVSRPTTSSSSSSTTAVAAPVRIWPRCADGCETPSLTLDGIRYIVGGPGDLAVIADAGCDGHPDAIVVRPSTGALYVFSGWPGEGDEISARPRSSLPPPIDDLSVAPSAEAGCGHLVASGDEGESQLALVALAP